ncbi:MAG: nucleotide exchange factor GrpE [Deltaproteobacteria bacterium]|nr:nucleotide exchange factor GrpE [Deltaproteobacteria bacterium]
MRQRAEARLEVEELDREHREQVRKLLLGVLETIDAFDRVFRSVASKPDTITPQMRIWLNNFRTVRRLLERVVTEQGLVPIVANPEDSFDPHWHRVSRIVADPTRPEGAIVEITAPGWVWHGAVLRKTEVVVVSNNHQVPDESQTDEGGT